MLHRSLIFAFLAVYLIVIRIVIRCSRNKMGGGGGGGERNRQKLAKNRQKLEKKPKSHIINSVLFFQTKFISS